MKNITIVVSRLRLTIVTFFLVATVLLSLSTPKNEKSEKMIVEFNNRDSCEILLWNGEDLVARLHSDKVSECKFYLIKNSDD